MKKVFIILMTLIGSISAKGQCDYADFSDAPEELYRKRVKEQGMRYGNPYTMFVKDNNFNLVTTLSLIRKNIENGEPDTLELFNNDYARLYAGIYASADEPEPAKCPELQEVEDCMHAAWVKNNAIIYLIGLKYLKI